MSPSPTDSSDRKAVDQYAAAWQAIIQSARSGNSWSGSETNRAFLNLGGSRFADASHTLGLGFKDDGRALALTDWDGDGDLDLWVHNRTAPRLRLLRNNTPPASGSITFRLIGKGDSNRDAIGARLRLTLADGAVLSQTLRAGSGFLSQSSKWVHFGFGRLGEPKSLEISWPDGSVQTVKDLAANRRYWIEQGSEANLVPDRKVEISLAAGERPVSEERRRQMVLPGKIPLPNFRYTPAGQADEIELTPSKKPLLLILFSGSCPSCAKELAEFAEAADQIREGGVEVLALSVDELPEGGSNAEAERLIAESGFPFPTGKISSMSAEHLRLLLSALYDFPAPFSVPMSLLLDQKRDLFALYQESTSPELVLHDAEFCYANSDQLRDLAVPFPGRWFTESISRSLLTELIAKPFRASFPEQKLRYLEREWSTTSDVGRKSALQRRLGSGYYRLAWQFDSEGDFSKAADYYEKTLALNPNNYKARIDFGALLGGQGKLEEAEMQFRKALELDPENKIAQRNLKLILQRKK